ncbi:MAG: outer membrane protein assembly factor BamE [Tepidimonas ignava]|nr:outer membrane protein assembly factor BamE [Tepidimonas ignava]MCX7815712.1 outer membrane protein assembly factor BamE [Tepidimonas ignava]
MPPIASFHRHRVAAAALGLAALGLAGCSSMDGLSQRLSTLGGVITPYRIDILQGNVVVREQVEALQPGMSRQQVQAILGTPLVASIFHADRWDYVFTYQRQGQPVQRRVVTVWFDGDRMARAQADGELPTEREFVAALQVRRPTGEAPPLQASDDQLKAAQPAGSTARAADAPAAPATPPAGASYPPLEAR